MGSPFSVAVLALGLAGGLAGGLPGYAGTAQAASSAWPGTYHDGAARLIFVGGDCSQAAAQVVDKTGGQLLSAQPTSDGQACVITVLVQGDGTSRPRKIRVQVPM